ncbi:hypothetical protein [Noviherbaspirillum sedimenti]|uniref:hypothetical protein n=1 Tax=Noviherbaspirillum sedimenti TaxID=2320865 RepID=UPI0018F623E4|nr:hypothetical protein [Noviherbaspirillum sedimenti]
MAKPNYAFEKRQKELAKKQKQQEKQQKKLATQNEPSRDDVTSQAPRGIAGRDV